MLGQGETWLARPRQNLWFPVRERTRKLEVIVSGTFTSTWLFQNRDYGVGLPRFPRGPVANIGALMEFTLLGCGTSTGVPIPGCSCRVCTSEDPRNYRDRTSALITLDSGTTILVDAGPDLRQQALKHKIPSVDNVIFTHSHADHILGTDDLRNFNFISSKRIACFATEATFAGIKQTFPYIFNPNPFYQGGMVAQLDVEEIQNDQEFSIAGTTIIPFPLSHGAVTVTGFRIGQLGYATDLHALSERAEHVLRGVKYLFIDGLRFEPHPTHLTIQQAIEISQRLQAQQTFLVHMTHTIDYHEVSTQLPKGVALGYDGLKVSFF